MEKYLAKAKWITRSEVRELYSFRVNTEELVSDLDVS